MRRVRRREVCCKRRKVKTRKRQSGSHSSTHTQSRFTLPTGELRIKKCIRNKVARRMTSTIMYSFGMIG